VCEAATLLNKKNYLQILHFTGSSSSSIDIKATYARHGLSAVVSDFENEMSHAWAAADLVIARAGASTIAEQMAFAVPGILIPYPYATDQHQEKNAKYFEEVVGGAKRLQESSLKPHRLACEIETLLDEATSQEMRKCLILAQERVQECHFSQQIVTLLQGM
jgi:UDP-N-acetylglucosamine--N-acetylmuramyl-(pentapeptide) pyrophosphoryl-undecaprenol N-acetylglucosamine transferase